MFLTRPFLVGEKTRWDLFSPLRNPAREFILSVENLRPSLRVFFVSGTQRKATRGGGRSFRRKACDWAITPRLGVSVFEGAHFGVALKGTN